MSRNQLIVPPNCGFQRYGTETGLCWSLNILGSRQIVIVPPPCFFLLFFLCGGNPKRLQCTAVRCSVLQYVAVCCSVLQYVAVCCSRTILPQMKVLGLLVAKGCSVLQSVATCCSVLNCVAMRCSMLQCVVACTK